MTFTALIVVLGLTGVLLLISSVRNIRRSRIARSILGFGVALVLFLTAGGALLLSANLESYRRLTTEQPAGQLQFTRLGYHQFNGVFTFPSGDRTDFALRGDEWQIDARILKWRAFANLVGFDTAYRLERISGRYASVDDERNQPRTVYPLNPPDRIDLWELLRRYQIWLPWFDALYGNATYLPMADGALYEIRVSQSGLLARPLNPAARAAVGSWR
jgi:hypothetical protein